MLSTADGDNVAIRGTDDWPVPSAALSGSGAAARPRSHRAGAGRRILDLVEERPTRDVSGFDTIACQQSQRIHGILRFLGTSWVYGERHAGGGDQAARIGVQTLEPSGFTDLGIFPPFGRRMPFAVESFRHVSV